MTYYWILFSVAAIVSLVVVYYFFVGLADGSVSSRNGLLWLGLLAVVAGVMLGSWWLKSHDKVAAANVLLCVLAVPGLIAALFALFILIGKPRWN